VHFKLPHFNKQGKREKGSGGDEQTLKKWEKRETWERGKLGERLGRLFNRTKNLGGREAKLGRGGGGGVFFQPKGAFLPCKKKGGGGGGLGVNNGRERWPNHRKKKAKERGKKGTKWGLFWGVFPTGEGGGELNTLPR